jgi:hypothetical protein
MPYTVVSLSTGSTLTSSPVTLNWRGGKPTSISVTASSSFACDFTVQYTLDDIMLVGGSSVAAWAGISSATGQPATHFLSSTAFPDGVSYTFPGAVGAVRLGSSSLGGGTGGTLTMRVMQGETI